MALSCVLSLGACSTHKPSIDEIAQSIEEGSLTFDDALDKKWITQEWADEYFESHSVPAGSKIDDGALGEFTTTTLSRNYRISNDLHRRWGR